MTASDRFVATSSMAINASPTQVWQVITDPAAMKEFFFGSEVTTDWTVGTPIVWRGVWEGRPYEDRGEVVEFEPGRKLVTTHFSPLTGQPDIPENYHTLTWTLQADGADTMLILSQDNNGSAEGAAHSKDMWDTLVASVKNIAERQPGS